jgi:hypothetical protein
MVSWIWVVQLPLRRVVACFLEMLVKPVDDLRLYSARASHARHLS